MSDDRSSSQGSRSWLDKLLGAFSSDSEEPSSVDELKLFLRDVGTRLSLDQDGMAIIEGAFEISDQQAREAMIPRSQIVVIRADQSPEDFLPIIMDSAHSRYPVVDR